MTRPFLTARWENLLLINYVCPNELLEPLIPAGTKLDTWDGRALVSLVGFMFRGTRIKGLPIPFHRTFEEVNLRLYVRREVPGGEVRRGVVFIRELVPRFLVAAVARTLYNEPYVSVPMVSKGSLHPVRGGTAEYGWSYRGDDFRMSASAVGAARRCTASSEAEFITEHYWGYTRRPDGRTTEYRVDHPPWTIWDPDDATFSGSAAALYGPAFADVLSEKPRSAYLTRGSEISVYSGFPID